MDNVFDWLVSKEAIGTYLIIIIAFAALFLLSHFTKRKRANSELGTFKNNVVHTFFSIIRFLIIFGTILIVLQINGVNITSIVAGLGIAGAVVGLALQDYLKDVIMGIHIIFDKFYALGDVVEYKEKEYTVIDFNLKSTKLEDCADHSVYTVCNRNISEIKRFEQRIDFHIPISYEEDSNKVNSALSEICSELAKNKKIKKCEVKGILNFDKSSLEYVVRVYCEPKNRADVKYIVHGRLYDGLKEKGIFIPFEQLDVHLNSKK